MFMHTSMVLLSLYASFEIWMNTSHTVFVFPTSVTVPGICLVHIRDVHMKTNHSLLLLPTETMTMDKKTACAKDTVGQLCNKDLK